MSGVYAADGSYNVTVVGTASADTPVSIDQTTPGTTNGVVVNSGGAVGEVQASPTANTILDRLKALLTGIVLAAGSAIIGKVGIDQTTPGTTNLVTANGTAAHGGNVNGNPFRLAGRVKTTANLVLSSADNTCDIITTANGATIQKPFSIPALDWSYASATGGISNTTTAVTIKTAAGASTLNYITSLQISTDALGAATELAIRDGAAGTVLWRMKLGTGGIASYQVNFNSPLKGTANTLLEIVTLTASITGGVFVNAQGYAASP